MGEKRGMKALEAWCRRVTDGYRGVSVHNMTTSWRDGLAFCALIHHFRPDLIDFDSLDKDDILGNNELAFRTAEHHLGIPALLDAADMVQYAVPDRLSILTYLSQFYQAFAGSSQGPSPSHAAKKRPSSTPPPEFVAASDSPPSPPSKIAARPVLSVRRDPCAKCGLPVFIAERLLVNGCTLYHRSCFRCARCHHPLSLANCYETEDGDYCCEACPDEVGESEMAGADHEDRYSADFEDALEQLPLQPPREVQPSDLTAAARSSFMSALTMGAVADDTEDTSSFSVVSSRTGSPASVRGTMADTGLRASSEEWTARRGDGEEAVMVPGAEVAEAADCGVSTVPSDKGPSATERTRNADRSRLCHDVEPRELQTESDEEIFAKEILAEGMLNGDGVDRIDELFRKVCEDADEVGQGEGEEGNVSRDLFCSEKLDLVIGGGGLDMERGRPDEVWMGHGTEKCEEWGEGKGREIPLSHKENPSRVLENQKKTREVSENWRKSDEVLGSEKKANEVLKGEKKTSEVLKGEKKTSEVLKGEKEASEVLKGEKEASEVLKGEKEASKVLKCEKEASKVLNSEKEASKVLKSEKEASEVLEKQNKSGEVRENEKFSGVLVWSKREKANEVCESLGEKRGEVQQRNKREKHDKVCESNKDKAREVCEDEEKLAEAHDGKKDEPGIVVGNLKKLVEVWESKKEDVGVVCVREREKEKAAPEVGKEQEVVISLPLPQEVDYPEELNPFGNDAEEVPDGSSTNPFGLTDEEDREVEEGKASVVCEERKRRTLEAPKVNLNPFWSDDNEASSEDEAVAKPPVPVPLPRTIKCAITPEPSPPPRKAPIPPLDGSERFGSATSLSSMNSSVSSLVRRKKKPAPLPPSPKDIFPAVDVVVSSSSSRASSPTFIGQSPQLAPRKRKSRPAPPPPLDRLAVEQWEHQKLEKDEANRSRQCLTVAVAAVDRAGAHLATNKSMYGQWKRKKGPAPPRPVPQRRQIKTMPMEEVRRELDDIEVQQQELERQGVTLEHTIRTKFEQSSGADNAGDCAMTPDVEDLVLQLFELVNEKNELFRRQAELMYLRRQQRLEEEHADLEFQIRCLLERPDACKTDSDKAREEELIRRLVEVVARRNEIVDCLEMDRLREAEEDHSIHTQLGIFAAKSKSADRRSMEGGVNEKEKKKKHKEKEKKKKAVADADKDIDEVETHAHTHNHKKMKKKWFL